MASFGTAHRESVDEIGAYATEKSIDENEKRAGILELVSINNKLVEELFSAWMTLNTRLDPILTVMPQNALKSDDDVPEKNGTPNPVLRAALLAQREELIRLNRAVVAMTKRIDL